MDIKGWESGLVFRKQSYPTPVAGRRTLQVMIATWKSHNWKDRYPKKNEIQLKRNRLLLTLKLHSILHVLALMYKKIRIVSRIIKLKTISSTSYPYRSCAVCTCFPSDLKEFLCLLALSNLAFLLTPKSSVHHIVWFCFSMLHLIPYLSFSEFWSNDVKSVSSNLNKAISVTYLSIQTGHI